MRRYANIINNKIANIAVFEHEPTFNPVNGYWYDVTEISCGKGDIYDEATDTFSKPETPVKKEAVITNRELWARFTDAEKQSLADASDKLVKKLLYDFQIKAEFNLNDQEIKDNITGLETLTLLAKGRALEILTP